MSKNNKTDIKEALDFVKKSIKEEGNTKATKTSVDEEYVLLEKIISRKEIKNKEDTIKKDFNSPKANHLRKGQNSNISENKKIEKIVLNKKKGDKSLNKKDPVAQLVDREIKPIIKKWINKNLKLFVKRIVIEEMKLISKATKKPTSR